MGPWDPTWREQFRVEASCLKSLLVLLTGSEKARSDWTRYTTSEGRLTLPPTTRQALESYARHFFDQCLDGASRWADFSEERVVATRGRGQIAELCRDLDMGAPPATGGGGTDAIFGPPSPRTGDGAPGD